MWNEKHTAVFRKEPGYSLYGYKLHFWEESVPAPWGCECPAPGLAVAGRQQAGARDRPHGKAQQEGSFHLDTQDLQPGSWSQNTVLRAPTFGFPPSQALLR